MPERRPKPCAGRRASSDRAGEQTAKLDHLGDEFVGEAAGLDTNPSGRFDQLGNRRKRFGPELACVTLDGVRGKNQRHRIAGVHRLLDRGQRLGPVFAEITQNADEARTKLGPALFEMRPVDDVVTGFVFLIRPLFHQFGLSQQG